MTEIKKLTKITLVVEAIIWLMFGVLLLFLTDMLTVDLTGWTNPLHPRAFGAICLISAFFAVIMLRKKEWEEIKMTFAYFSCLILSTIILEILITAVYSSTLSAAVISQVLLDVILMCSMLALSVISYYKQER